ncbi:sensor histidine kinase [uncultured Microscilla sp.]|uniref:sensor histidine kinase n=1 Tax=uncultured Microscilla sp. TaxID=432653 RepID=UPI0026343FF1|nr:histidine kinase [uncultured Microscilla sp.]
MNYLTHTSKVVHLLFWGIVWLFYTLFFGHQNANYASSFLLVSMLLPITAGTLYLLNYCLIPRFLLQKKYRQFAFFTFGIFVLSLWLQAWAIVLTIILVAKYQVSSMTPASLDVYFLIVGMYWVVFFGVAIKLFKHWYQSQQKNQWLVQYSLENELRLKEAELQLLKAQIHPHFLFNTLNSLYGLTLEKSDNAPEVVIKLSELLDYVLYKSNQPKVLLQDEIKHLQNFISLEQLRYENKLELHWQTEGQLAGQYIAPMLILPFIENCFKHGVSNEAKKCWINVFLKVSNDALQLCIANSKTVGADSALPYKSGSGIGLQNVQKRLGLLYKDQHTLEIEDKTDEFRVSLMLRFSEK